MAEMGRTYRLRCRVGRRWGGVEGEQKRPGGCEELGGEAPAEECGPEQSGKLVLAVPPPPQPTLIMGSWAMI